MFRVQRLVQVQGQPILIAKGLLDQLCQGPIGDHLAVIDDDDTITERLGLVQLVGGQEERDT